MHHCKFLYHTHFKLMLWSLEDNSIQGHTDLLEKWRLLHSKRLLDMEYSLIAESSHSAMSKYQQDKGSMFHQWHLLHSSILVGKEPLAWWQHSFPLRNRNQLCMADIRLCLS